MEKYFELYTDMATRLVATGIFDGSNYTVAQDGSTYKTLDDLFGTYLYTDTIVYLDGKSDYGYGYETDQNCVSCGTVLWVGEDDFCVYCQDQVEVLSTQDLCHSCNEETVETTDEFYPYCQECALIGIANLTLFKCIVCEDLLLSSEQESEGVCQACDIDKELI